MKPRRVFALCGLAFVLACVLALQAGGAKAATGGITGTRAIITQISSSTSVPTGGAVQPNLNFYLCTNMTDILTPPVGCPANSGGDDGPDEGGASASHLASNAAHAAAGSVMGMPNTPSTGRKGAGAPLANFNGISDDDSHAVNGFHVTPPDQGLCVGTAGPLEAAGLKLGVPANTSVVLEAVNDAWRVFDTSGNPLTAPDTLADLFSDPFASGDVSCNYDPATQTYFFTEIGGLLTGPDAGNYGTDLAVISPSGYKAYQVDTSESANCFPDFPHQGYDNNAFYLTIDEFCGPGEPFVGTSLFALSKPDLVSLGSPGGVEFDNQSLGGIPVLAMQPAQGDGTNTEYLVNSVPYDAFGNNASIANTLGLWQVTGDQNIDSNPSGVTLTGKSMPSELYAFPQSAASTGDSTTPAGSPSYVINEPFLNPDDSRLEQVQYANGTLYTSLNTALTVGSNPNPVDGAAWFTINPTKGKISKQGYIGVSGTYLLYPSFLRTGSGTLILDFSMTSPTMNPSTGYTLSKNGGNSFASVVTTGIGSGPHASFSDLLFARPRWGDYSAIALDPNSGDAWMADEYVVPTAAPPIDNWGTRVWGLSR